MRNIKDIDKNKQEYDLLNDELGSLNIALARCIDNDNVDELPNAILRLKEFLGKVNGDYIEFFRRPLNLLHSILITRMYYNKNFRSPLYEYNLESMAIYASSEVEYRNLFAIYLNAIETSLLPQEA